ncbi:hypothetical protein DM02DRAFT_613849 [Periconia macrospinosa]|uniref:FAD/NAD(P)-binding domain-containing protein n=1 Tax=Periconia macrospinosa TaxID=97972 RepID=A0A2V1DTA4_9PLEO|nr:hypothetical protein DM02DRAFT_613849 [Periconia macrospinosa]
MAHPLPQCVDTVIIGNGPSALILSYILHGHIPYYTARHHDAILDQKLQNNKNLLGLTPHLYDHFLASLRYSTQALPVNTLLDTLIRPNADTEINPTSCVEWRYEPEKAIPHIVIGDAPRPGGQWADTPVSATAATASLSYAEQLSLPGYSYAQHLAAAAQKTASCDFVRPTRSEVADYLSAYPSAVGISDAIYSDTRADNVYRESNGFVIGSLGTHCQHLVLASGIFTVNLPPPPLLDPVARLNTRSKPLLVIGSGFSAADVIISAPLDRRIIHIFQWAPETRPSPLRSCHHTAYPEYASIYRQMKLSAIANHKKPPLNSPLRRRKSSSPFIQRDWSSTYEGFPNAEIIDVFATATEASAIVTIRLASGEDVKCEVGGLAYVVGRRGTLDFLSPALRAEVLEPTNAPISPMDATTSPTLISGRTMRSKVETSLEVAKNVFIIGSLAGDSLIRHAIGGCVFAAGRIMHAIPPTCSPSTTVPASPPSTSRSISPSLDSDNSFGLSCTKEDQKFAADGHEDLHLDRRKLMRAVEVVNAENLFWVGSGWWAGGLGPGTLEV